MHILRWELILLGLCGCWRPISWTSKPKKILYNLCRIVSIFFAISFLLSLILDLIFNVDNQEDFTENIYITLEVITSSWKLCIFLINHRNYAILIDTLQAEPLAPVTIDEIEIQTRFDKLAQLNAVAYTSSLVVCIISLIVTPILTDFKGRKLSCRAWIPYDYTAPFTFIVTYIYQSACIVMCALTNVASDCLFIGLLIHTHCLFEILGSRLKKILINGNDSAKQCVRLHNRIYKFAMMVNKEFRSIIFIQFVASTAILCIELYRLTRRKLDSRFIDTIIYGSCALLQILFYCWYGNEVREKSLNIADMIIESNWASLDNGSKKILLMIMKRATMPIEFRSIYIASMNLASFMALLKTSYSVYNLLQRGQE